MIEKIIQAKNIKNKYEYWAVHRWIEYHYGKAKIYLCSNNNLHGGRMQWANVDGIYERDIKHFTVLCTGCNLNYDRGNITIYQEEYRAIIRDRKYRFWEKGNYPIRKKRTIQKNKHPLQFYFPELAT